MEAVADRAAAMLASHGEAEPPLHVRLSAPFAHCLAFMNVSS